MKVKEQEVGGFGLIQKNENGSISQIGLTESQYILLELFLSSIGSLVRLPNEYNLETEKKLKKHIRSNRIL